MVSVIIPIYNVEKYLRECVDSVLAQTYTDLEIILVDDGSPDNCGAICDEYAARDSRIKVIHKKNGGLSDARNAGLKIARGEYIYFLDSDDYIRNDAVEKLVKSAEVQKPDIIFFNAVLFFDDGPNTSDAWIHKGDYPPCRGNEMLGRRIANVEWLPGVPIHFYSADFLRRERLIFKKGILYEDQLFSAFAFLRAKKVCFLGEPLYYYRTRRSDSIMNSKTNAKGFGSYHICVRGLLNERTKYPSDSPERKNLEILAKGLCNEAANYYCRMERKERKKVSLDVTGFRQALEMLRTVKCGALKLKFKYPLFLVIYKKTFGAVKEYIKTRS